MRAVKIIGAGVFALFAFGSLINFIGRLPQILNAISYSSTARGSNSVSFALGQFAGALLMTALFAAIARALWKSAAKAKHSDEVVASPLPEVPRRGN